MHQVSYEVRGQKSWGGQVTYSTSGALNVIIMRESSGVTPDDKTLNRG